MTATVEILGAYRISLSDEDIRSFLMDSFGEALDDDEIEGMVVSKKDELRSVVGFDVIVRGVDDRFDVGDFSQPDSDQVAYDEVFLTVDGQAEDESPSMTSGDLRVYFFLHDVDENKPLNTSYGAVAIPEIRPLPEHLAELHPFTPVD